MKKRTQTTPRGAAIIRALTALRLLVDGDVTPSRLAERLHISQRTADRLLRAFGEAGLELECRRDGVHAYYTLPRERLHETLGV